MGDVIAGFRNGSRRVKKILKLRLVGHSAIILSKPQLNTFDPVKKTDVLSFSRILRTATVFPKNPD